jgi:hypothetical protein
MRIVLSHVWKKIFNIHVSENFLLEIKVYGTETELKQLQTYITHAVNVEIK